MPASIACRATGVIAAPSKGSSTIASTLSLMNVSTWAIWASTLLVPSASRSSTSSYCLATASVESVIEAIQPWSAAGAEKPMTILSPGSSLPPASALELVRLGFSGSSEDSLLVQALSPSTATTASVAVTFFRRLMTWCRDMSCSLVAC